MKDLELEARKFMPNKRRSSTGAIQYGEKQRLFSDSAKYFNTMTYSGDFSTLQRRGYTITTTILRVAVTLKVLHSRGGLGYVLFNK